MSTNHERSGGRGVDTATVALDGGPYGDHPSGDIVLLLSVADAARALGLGRTKIYELIAAGDIEVVHIGRCARVPLDAVERYVERLRAG